MADIVEIAENTIELYVKKYPQVVNMDIYRGGNWSFTIIGKNGDDTPFDWGVVDEFNMQFRVGHPLSNRIVAELQPSNFVLGKTDNSQAEEDELHLVDPDGSLFKELKIPKLYHDLDYVIGSDIHTAIKGIANLEFDVTR